MILFATIPLAINADASWWITGFYNYLLPVSVALYVFSVSFCKKKNIPEKIICIILAFYFPYMEQAGIAFTFAIICLIFARRKTVSYFDITILIIVLVNLIICLKAPGNERRFILETWTWYPQYQTYGIINKLSLGFDKLHQLMTLKNNIPLIAFCSILFYVRSTFSNMSISVKVAMFFIATFISISIANSLTGILSGSLLLGGVTIDATRWYAVKLFLSYFYLSVVISSILILLIDCQLHQKIKSTPIIAIMIGFMTVTMMGLSPTVYASGLRVDFIFEIACIISCMSIAHSLKKQ